MKRIIALTGPTGAGKSVVGDIFRSLGIPVIDTDQVYHDLLIPPSGCLDDLVSAFGKTILKKDGTLDRSALSELVFADPDQLKKLNGITHLHVRRRVLGIISEMNEPTVCLDAPAILDSPIPWDTDKTISVLSDKELRLKRIMERDGLSREGAEKRMKAQHDDAFYASHSDLVLYNRSGTVDEALTELTDQLLPALKQWGVVD